MTNGTDDLISRIDALTTGFVDDDLTVSADAMRSAPSPLPTPSVEEVFGEAIHIYTRAQAIADGVLVEAPQALVRDAGISLPLALTSAAWQDCVAWTDEDSCRKGFPQDETGRLWDVLWMCRSAYRSLRMDSRAAFQLYRLPRGGKARAARLVTLHIGLSLGDDGRPVLTIMKPGED